MVCLLLAFGGFLLPVCSLGVWVLALNAVVVVVTMWLVIVYLWVLRFRVFNSVVLVFVIV